MESLDDSEVEYEYHESETEVSNFPYPTQKIAF